MFILFEFGNYKGRVKMTTSIIKTPMRTFDAQSFIDKFQQHIINAQTIDPENYLYIAIAKQTDWGTNGSSGSELNPELPVDTVDQEVRFWTDTIALQRIQPHQIVPVVPRRDWSNQVLFVPYDTSKQLDEQGNYYAMNELFQVFRCTQAHPVDFPSVAPTWVTGDPSVVVGSDGYGWEYLYQISPVDIQNTLSQTDVWIPIPEQYAAGAIGDGKEFPMRYIHTRHILARADITETSMPIANPDTSPITYRQVGLILNPRDVADGTTQLTSSSLLASDVTKLTSGNYLDVDSRLIYLENRTIVTRQAGQTESKLVVIEF